MNAQKDDLVKAMPRRTAHALHALLEANRDLRMPPTAAEVCIYDPEARSVRSTGAALRSAAQRDGRLAACANGYWVPGSVAQELRLALETRFLADTEDKS